MDLWDLTKVLWRRRWIALPLLVVSGLVGFLVMSTVRPEYQATGHVTLLPPSQQRATDPKAGSAPQTVSPWNVYSLADALVIYAARGDVKREFQNAGFSEEFTATIGGSQLPIIEVEVIASSAEQAKATLNRVIEFLNSQLERLQTPYGVKGGEAISAQTLDSGQNIKVLTSAKKRMLIVVVAIAMILTVSVCLGVDAILRRRKRAPGAPRPAARRVAEAPSGGGGGTTAPGVAQPQPARVRSGGSVWRSGRASQAEEAEIEWTVQSAAADHHTDAGETQLIDVSRPVERPEPRPAPRPEPEPGTETTSTSGVTQRAGHDVIMVDYRLSTPGADAGPATNPPPEDSTIILPLAGINGWAGSTGERHHHRPKGAENS